MAVCVIWHDKHAGDWLTAFATPYRGCAGLLHGKACHTILRSLCFLTNRVPLPPLCRGQNKTPRDNLLINPPLEMTILAGSIGHAFDVRVQRVVLSPSRAMSFIGLPGRPTPSTTGVVPLPLQAGGGKFTGERSLSRLRARIYEGSSIECRRLFPYFPKREGGGLLL